MNFSTPNSNNENVFLPIEAGSENVNFLDFRNDGLKAGVNPNKNQNELFARAEQQARKG